MLHAMWLAWVIDGPITLYVTSRFPQTTSLLKGSICDKFCRRHIVLHQNACIIVLFCGVAADNSAQKPAWKSMAGPMAVSPSCLIHFKGETGQLTRFTETSLGKVKNSHTVWLLLDGQQREIAEKIAPTLASLQESIIDNNLHYHRNCYSKFTNVTLIKGAQVRCSQKGRNRR